MSSHGLFNPCQASLGVPDARSALYMASTIAIFVIFGYAAARGTAHRTAMAIMLTFGSAAVAVIMQLASRRVPGDSLASHLLFPHDRSVPKLAYYFISSGAVVLWPLYHLALLVLP